MTITPPCFPSLAWSAFLCIRKMTDISRKFFPCLRMPWRFACPSEVCGCEDSWCASESGQDFPQTPTPEMANDSPEGHLAAWILAEEMGKEFLCAWGAAPCCGHVGMLSPSQGQEGGWYLNEKRLSFWKAANLAIRNWEVWENQDTFPGRPVLVKCL